MCTFAGDQPRTQQAYDDVVAEQWARAFLVPATVLPAGYAESRRRSGTDERRAAGSVVGSGRASGEVANGAFVAARDAHEHEGRPPGGK